MSYQIDTALFRALAEYSPAEVCHRAQCRHDDSEHSYYLMYWGDEYRIDCLNETIDRLTSNSIALLYWLGDEEFPAEAKLLLDKSISGSLALDSVYALAVDACSRVSQFQ